MNTTTIGTAPTSLSSATIFAGTKAKPGTLQSKYVFAKVTVSVKVKKLADPEIVRTGKQKQEVHVADHNSTTEVILWEEDIGKLHEQSSYRLENFVVKEWGGTK